MCAIYEALRRKRARLNVRGQTCKWCRSGDKLVVNRVEAMCGPSLMVAGAVPALWPQGSLGRDKRTVIVNRIEF